MTALLNTFHAWFKKGKSDAVNDGATLLRRYDKGWSGRLDLNQRPPRPERGALPD